MTDNIPTVKPRDMHALIAQTAGTHAEVRQHIVDAATAREEYYANLNQELNAKARLDGKVKM